MDRKLILSNCNSSSGFQGVDFNISAERLVDLLLSFKTARGDLGRKCSEVLRSMEVHRWNIAAGLHQGGIGGQGRAADPRPHVTLRVQNDTYHLRFHKGKEGLSLMEIT